MIVNVSEEAIEKIRQITEELFTLIHDEVESQTDEGSEFSLLFGWYQIIIQVVQYILVAANEVLKRVED